MTRLRKMLDRLRWKRKQPPLPFPEKSDIVWVDPTLIAEIEFRAWTETANCGMPPTRACGNVRTMPTFTGSTSVSGGTQPSQLHSVATEELLPCSIFNRMEDKDWVSKWAQDAESLINLMPAYQMNPDQLGPIVRNTADGKTQLVHARWGLPSPIFVQKKAAEARAEN